MCMAHDGGCQLVVKLFHEAVGGGMVGACPAVVCHIASSGSGKSQTRADFLDRYGLRETEVG
jgi:hypothetical protein